MLSPRTLARHILDFVGLGKHARQVLEWADFNREHGWQYRSIHGYRTIPGWLSPQEAKTLFDLARSLPNRGPIVVEIGSFQGKSSLVLAKGLKAKIGPKLFCIDPFNADGDPCSKPHYAHIASQISLPLREQFIANMKRNRVYDMIELLTGYSTDFAGTFSWPISLLFIDGNHEYDAVLRDYLDWSPLLSEGGIIAMHDVWRDPTSERLEGGPAMVAMGHVIGKPGWSETKLVDSLLYAKRTA